MKNANFVPKDVQRILSSHKISEMYCEQEVFYEIFAIFTGKHRCWSLFFNDNAGLQACKFIKNRLQHKHFSLWLWKNITVFLSLLSFSVLVMYLQRRGYVWLSLLLLSFLHHSLLYYSIWTDFCLKGLSE